MLTKREKLQCTCINLSEISTSKDKNNIIHNVRTSLKGREFGLVNNGTVLLHKAAVWQL